MKQSAITLIILITLVVAPVSKAFATSLDDIFDEFKNYEQVEYVKIPRFVMWLAKFSDDSDATKKINGLKVLTFSKTESSVKNKFEKRFKQLSTGLETLLTANDDGDNVRILTKMKGDKFKDFYIYAADEDEIVLVKFSGTFSADDIMSLAEDEKNKKRH